MEQFETLTDIELDHVAGGSMSCSDALIVAKVDIALSTWYSSMGMSAASAANSGHAIGVLQGACPA
jgi:hypothetical protein